MSKTDKMSRMIYIYIELYKMIYYKKEREKGEVTWYLHIQQMFRLLLLNVLK